jgi:succinate dehydrogenase/fumarate reductase flavoprotein subunit
VFDVLVVGSGASGLAGALSSQERNRAVFKTGEAS